MAYVKQNVFVTGSTAIAGDLDENFEDARRYINQEIVAADITDETISEPEIVRGELNTTAGIDYQFTCGNSYGIFKNSDERNWNGFTDTTKQEYIPQHDDQGSFTDELDLVVINKNLTLPDTWKQIVLEQRAIVTYRAFLAVEIPQQVVPDIDNSAILVKHRYNSSMFVSINEVVYDDLTSGRFYDESTFSSPWGGGPSSWGGGPGLDPNRDTVLSDGYANNIPPLYYRRQMAVYKSVALAPGTYDVGIVYDAHHAKGLVKATNVTIEVEYIGASIS